MGGSLISTYWSPELLNKVGTEGYGEPRRIQEMLNSNTFLNWDFNSTWQIDENGSLPYLQGMEKPNSVTF